MAPWWHRASLRPKCERTWSCGEISLHALIRVLCILWWRQFYRTVTSYISLFTVKIIRRKARGNGRLCLIKNIDEFQVIWNVLPSTSPRCWQPLQLKPSFQSENSIQTSLTFSPHCYYRSKVVNIG